MKTKKRDGSILEDGTGFYFAGGIIKVEEKYQKELKNQITEENKW